MRPTPLVFCVSAHSRHKRYFRISLTARNLLKCGPFETSVTMPIMLKMLIMDGFAVQTQCKIQVWHASLVLMCLTFLFAPSLSATTYICDEYKELCKLGNDRR
jgi:hypothetical protein